MATDGPVTSNQVTVVWASHASSVKLTVSGPDSNFVQPGSGSTFMSLYSAFYHTKSGTAVTLPSSDLYGTAAQSGSRAVTSGHPWAAGVPATWTVQGPPGLAGKVVVKVISNNWTWGEGPYRSTTTSMTASGYHPSYPQSMTGDVTGADGNVGQAVYGCSISSTQKSCGFTLNYQPLSDSTQAITYQATDTVTLANGKTMVLKSNPATIVWRGLPPGWT